MQHVTDETELYRLVRSLPLTADSLAWVAGAHEGEQVRMLLDTYGCNVWAFEPQVNPYAQMVKEIQSDKLRAYNFGLGDITESRPMSGRGMGATYLLNSGITQITQVVDIVSFMNKRDIPVWRVDLFLMNVEGYEYVLLPYMIRTGLIKRFDRLLVQFHPVYRYDTTMEYIFEHMKSTHNLVWVYRDTLWVLWERNHE